MTNSESKILDNTSQINQTNCRIGYLFSYFLKNNKKNQQKPEILDVTNNKIENENNFEQELTNNNNQEETEIIIEIEGKKLIETSNQNNRCIFEESLSLNKSNSENCPFTTTPSNNTTTNENENKNENEKEIIIENPKNLKQWFNLYMELWKGNLTAMVVLTAYVGRAITIPAPNVVDNKIIINNNNSSSTIKTKNLIIPTNISSTSTTNKISNILIEIGKELIFGIGTFLLSGAAISINQIYEREKDKMMSRTKNRPIPTKRISIPHAIIQSIVSCTTGTLLLYYTFNPMTAAFGFINFLIYTAFYTPLKTIHWSNTWFGAIVGAIPPIMGSTSIDPKFDWNISNWRKGGSIAPSIIWGGCLFIWQITHFMALSKMCSTDYSRAGYKMLGIQNPKAAAVASLTHCALLFPLCISAPYFGVAHWSFVPISSLVNAGLLHRALLFNASPYSPDKARKLFYASLIHLPLISLALIFTSPKVISNLTSFAKSIGSLFRSK